MMQLLEGRLHEKGLTAVRSKKGCVIDRLFTSLIVS